MGAQRSSVLWLVMKRAAVLLLFGAVIGIPGALVATRLVKSMLYGVDAQDPMSVVISVIALVGVAGVASFLPARRATKVDPMVALRHE